MCEDPAMPTPSRHSSEKHLVTETTESRPETTCSACTSVFASQTMVIVCLCPNPHFRHMLTSGRHNASQILAAGKASTSATSLHLSSRPVVFGAATSVSSRGVDIPAAPDPATPSSASFSCCCRFCFFSFRLFLSAHLNGVPCSSCSAATTSKVFPWAAISLRSFRVRRSQMMCERKMPASRKQLFN